MPRPRKPTAVLELTGAFKHDPQRAKARETEPKPTGELGNAPAHLTDDEQKVWRQVRASAYWLTDADKHSLEIYCRLLARERRGEFKTGDYAQLRGFMGVLGLTPDGRSKRSEPPKKEVKDKLSSFLDDGLIDESDEVGLTIQ